MVMAVCSRPKGVGQRIMAAAIRCSGVSLMETAGEGGAWGIAILASYMNRKRKVRHFRIYLNAKVFHGEERQCDGSRMRPMWKDLNSL